MTEATKILHISIDEPLLPVAVEERYDEVLAMVSSEGSIVGQVWLPALSLMPVDLLSEAIAHQLGERLWQRQLAAAVRRTVRGSAERRKPQPSVSAVVCTRDRPDVLRSCIESLLALRTPPDEIVVIDNCPSDERTRLLCDELPVRYVREDHPGTSRARNRGILESTGDVIAFTDDDCVVDLGWLDDLGEPFADQLVLAVTGFIAPFELETRAQVLFEKHGGFEKHYERTVFDGTQSSPIAAAGLAGASANVIFRRRSFDEVGLFAEDLGPGTPARSAEDAYQAYRVLAAGYRIVFDPARVVRHQHRREDAALRRILSDYSISAFAYTTRCLLTHREPAVSRIWAWWFRHVLRDLSKSLRRSDGALPVRTVLAEGAGMFKGPWRLVRSRWSRRRIPPLELPPPAKVEPARITVAAAAPRLSVVLPSYNRREKLAEVLDGLRRQTYPADRYETTVVLDGSTDGSADLVRGLEPPFELRLIEQENRGLAASRNRGARESAEPVIVFLDDDTVPEPGFLAEHAQAHQASPNDHLALGYYPPVFRDTGLFGLALRVWWEEHFRRKAEPGHQWTYIDFAGGNASFPRALFLDVGGFDEEFTGRREDWELAVRLLERGVRFGYYPAAKSLHYFDASLETALRHERQHARDDILIASKHPQIKGQLPFARLVHDCPPGSERLERVGLPRARLLERLRLRGRWRRLSHRLLVNAYVLGLRESFPSHERFLAFVASIWQEPTGAVPFWLDHPGPFPPIADPGMMELMVGQGSTLLGPLSPVEAGEQWDWEVVERRVVERFGEGVRHAALLGELSDAESPVESAVGELLAR